MIPSVIHVADISLVFCLLFMVGFCFLFLFFEGGVDIEEVYIFAWSNLSLFFLYDFYFDMIGKAFPSR